MGIALNVTEWRSGHLGLGAYDHVAGEAKGAADGTALAVELLIRIPDIDRFANDASHTAAVAGHVVWCGDRRPITGGDFTTLADRHVLYRIAFSTAEGRRMTLLGHERLRDELGLESLPVRLYDREASLDRTDVAWPAGDVARGVLHSTVRDDVRRALSFVVTGARAHRRAATSKFLRYYGEPLHELYVAHTDPRPTLLALALATGAMFVASVLVMVVR